MIIKNAKLRGRKGLWRIIIRDGTIQKIDQNNDDNDNDAIDVDGRLVLPPFIEPHVHLDSTLTAGDPDWNLSGTLFEGIQLWSERKKTLTKEDVIERATKVLKWQIAQGIQHVRTHVDTTDPDFIGLQALLEIKEKISPWLDLQIVAFPQEGIYSFDNGVDLLEESIRMGADVVGGIPHFEFTREYGVKSIKKVFELGEKYNRLIDIHCDEIDDEQSRFVEVVAAEAHRLGIGKKVTASHTTAMHSYNDAYTAKLFRLLKLSEMNFIANPLVNIHLQGRFDGYPKRRGMTRVKELLAHGINVCFGHDAICDPWYPLGTGNIQDVLHMGIHVAQLMGYEEIVNSIDLITVNSAKALHLEDYGIEEGKTANLIVMNANDEYDAIRRQSLVKYSIRRGEIIAETKPAETTIHLGTESEKICFQR